MPKKIRKKNPPAGTKTGGGKGRILKGRTKVTSLPKYDPRRRSGL